ncbi:MAG: hypothetical protein F4X03_12980 [Dehalococcoidia bacterium]|nr:hypothetical protein [Dehalococcoidia bacterium]MYD29804.1 hypothetical protein [Dehalococcoidia bacterium]
MANDVADAERQVPEAAVAAVGISVDDLTALYRLESIRGFGPQKFKQLAVAGVSCTEVVADPARLPFRGRIGQSIDAQLRAQTDADVATIRGRAVRQILAAMRHEARIVTYPSGSYPQHLFESNNAVPALFVRGNTDVLGIHTAVACVGSRQIRPPYDELHSEFARRASGQGFVIVSGFALGADSIGHRAALESGGATICVMPGGLDRPFPPENRQLWDDLLRYPNACFVSEFAFGLRAAALTLRKRNKLIAAFSSGVLVSQTARSGGAMNAVRFAVEQRKPISTFAPDSSGATDGNEAVANLEGADITVFNLEKNRAEWDSWIARLSSST